jgi:Protein of unknown function (DUF3298)/Deacetylase PdaC
MKKLFFALFVASIAFACTPKGNDSTEQIPDSKDFAYLHFVGTIGNEPIRMNLLQDLDFDDNPWYNGYYHYENTQEPIGFYSSADSTGQGRLILTEHSVGDEPFGRFKGKLEKGVYRGEYSSPNGKKSPFELKLTFPEGTQEFAAMRLEKTEAADKERKDSPKGHFGYEYFIPSENWLKDAFLQEMVGDSLAQVYKTPQKAFDAQQQQFFKDYHEEIAGMLEEGEDDMYLNYDADKTMEVLFNQDNLLSIAVMDYSYAGGAHGNYGSACASFDLVKKKKITLEDVFKPGYETVLTKALTESAKKKFNTQDLSEILFVDKVEPNGNFFLTGKGICFNYVPYEIGAYAAGELKIFVPFTELKEIIKQQ